MIQAEPTISRRALLASAPLSAAAPPVVDRETWLRERMLDLFDGMARKAKAA